MLYSLRIAKRESCCLFIVAVHSNHTKTEIWASWTCIIGNSTLIACIWDHNSCRRLPTWSMGKIIVFTLVQLCENRHWPHKETRELKKRKNKRHFVFIVFSTKTFLRCGDLDVLIMCAAISFLGCAHQCCHISLLLQAYRSHIQPITAFIKFWQVWIHLSLCSLHMPG